jgi:hypothetical protein
MSTTKKLRLGPLPKLESTKLTFACPVSLKADLDQYAALHAQAYGEAVDAVTLIPHMLEAFMTGDRGFLRRLCIFVFQYAIIKSCGPLAQLVRAEDLTGRFLPHGVAKERKHPIGLLKVSSLCLEVELLKFGER